MGGAELEALKVYGPEAFTLAPDRNEVFGWLSCSEEQPCRAAFEEAWQEALRLLPEVIEPRGVIARGGKEILTVFVTLGAKPEKYMDRLFREGRYVLGSLLSTLCDEMLFQMDGQITGLLLALLEDEGLYPADRMEPGVDEPPELQRKRFLPMREVLPEVRISDRGTIFPTKSMMYGVALSHEPNGMTNLHDCSRCEQTDCLYRSAEYRKTAKKA